MPAYLRRDTGSEHGPRGAGGRRGALPVPMPWARAHLLKSKFETATLEVFAILEYFGHFFNSFFDSAEKASVP